VISFRYHLVSLIAVFLALALGIVVGTTALNGPITKDLRNQVNDAKAERDALAAQVHRLQGQVGDAGQFASTYGSQLVAGTVSGRVTITNSYLDPSGGTGIVALATGGSRPLGWTAPETNEADQVGGSLLAYVLLGHGQSTDLTQVLAGFAGLHMVSTGGQDITPSTLVVVFAHGGLGSRDYAGTAEESLVSAMASQGGHVVVAGDNASASQGGLISKVRSSKDDRATVCTVDNANNAFGQVSTVLALAGSEQGSIGQYGTDQSADALFPAPAK
jgi:hypothetical protein